MSRWADKAVEQLEKELEAGEISSAEYREGVRDVRAELEQEIEQAEKLVAAGFIQDKDVPRSFWFAGHCLYIHPEQGVIEL